MSVVLEIVDGPMIGTTFQFTEPDIFIFGRASDCQCRLISEDNTVSRHHFLLEVSPPECQIKDLGSLNGTYVNETKYGGRMKGEEPDYEKAAEIAEAIEIRNGDSINVGQTTMRVTISTEDADDSPAVCVRCKQAIPSEKRDELAYIGGTYMCRKCRPQLAASSPSIHPAKGGAELIDELVAAVVGKSGGAIPRIPGYKFVRELGKGGFGKVYLVIRERDNKKLALKVMLATKKKVSTHDVKLFQREMDNCMKLEHPSVVPFEEQGHVDGLFFFTMEFCSGGNARDLIKSRGGYLSVEDAIPLMFQVLDGLAYIHKNDFVHRDLKPENILLDSNQKVAKVGDLGMVKNFRSAGLSGLTAEGTFAGTIPYMPAEQISNYRFLDPRSDIFGIGATFYDMLTGETVYKFPRGVPPMKVILEGKVIPIGERKKKIPKDIAAVIDKAISPDPKQRYATAADMKKALQKAA